MMTNHRDGNMQYDDVVELVFGHLTEEDEERLAYGARRRTAMSTVEREAVEELHSRVRQRIDAVGKVQVAGRLGELRRKLIQRIEGQAGGSWRALFRSFDTDGDGT